MASVELPTPSVERIREDAVIKEAMQILRGRMHRGEHFTDPQVVRSYLVTKFSSARREVFHVCYLDTRHRLIADEALFFGSIDGAEVHPREVIWRCLHHNAAAVVLCHNHPSGVGDPSAADRALTRRLQEALRLIEVRVLDHIIVAGDRSYSFAMAGLL